MKRLILYFGIATLAFSIGAAAGRLWQTHSSHSQSADVISQRLEQELWPLSREIVSRSLQSHGFRTDKLRRNSNDEIVWRWLKESIVAYPQNWVKLNISYNEIYAVVMYPPEVIEASQLDYYNKELQEKGLPSLEQGKRYLPIHVYQGDIICPGWFGLIDMEEAKLVFFEGQSA